MRLFFMSGFPPDEMRRRHRQSARIFKDGNIVSATAQSQSHNADLTIVFSGGQVYVIARDCNPCYGL